MEEPWSGRWHRSLPLAIATTLGLMVLVVTVGNVFADPAPRAEAQIAWKGRLQRGADARSRNGVASPPGRGIHAPRIACASSRSAGPPARWRPITWALFRNADGVLHATYTEDSMMRPLFGKIEALGPWTAHIQAMDQAVAENDPGEAVRAWRQAYSAALSHPGWLGLLTVAAASLRLGAVPGLARAAAARARATYRIAFFRVRQQRSLNR